MPKQFKRSQGFQDTRGGGRNDEAKRVSNFAEMYKYSDEFDEIRTIGPVVSYATHWIDIDTKAKGVIGIGKPCLSWDSTKQEHSSKKACPYCEEFGKPTYEHFVNAIIRELQESEPKKKGKPTKSEKKTGFKELGSDAWTPVRVVRMTGGMLGKVKKLVNLNKHKVDGSTKVFDLSDDQYGSNLMVLYDPELKAAGDRYQAQKGDAAPLTEEEQEYLVWNIEDLDLAESLETASSESDNLAERAVERDDDDGKKKKSKKDKGGKKSKRSDDDFDDDFDDDDEDDDPKPKKSKKGKKAKDEPKPKKGKKSKSKSDDEDEPKKSKKAKGKKSKEEPSPFEDEDDDEPKKSKKSKGNKKSKDEPKKGKSKDKKSKKGKGKTKFDFDDDDGDD